MSQTAQRSTPIGAEQEERESIPLQARPDLCSRTHPNCLVWQCDTCDPSFVVFHDPILAESRPTGDHESSWSKPLCDPNAQLPKRSFAQLLIQWFSRLNEREGQEYELESMNAQDGQVERDSPHESNNE